MNDEKLDAEATPTIVEAIGVARAGATVVGVATARRGFSIPHLLAAEHFARELLRHEAEHLDADWGPHFDFCTWNASAAIILSFSSIEAAIDEAEDDISLPAALAKALDRAPTLEHVQALLAHRGGTPFDPGAEPFRSADLLRALRNGLVHPKAEWDDAKDRNRKLSRRIIGARLPLSPFQPNPDLAFPHGCMSAGVASWAAASARQFIREMRSRLAIAATV